MLRISITNDDKRQFITVSDIENNKWGKVAIDKYGLLLVYYLTSLTIAIESSGNVKAWNKSTAAGLFQFLSSTRKRYKKAHPALPDWSYDVDVQLSYFYAAFPEFMRRSPVIFNVAKNRGMTSGLINMPIPKLIYGFRLAYHIWSFANYDKWSSTKRDVDKENTPLKYAANAFAAHLDLLFRDPQIITIGRTSFNESSWLTSRFDGSQLAAVELKLKDHHGTVT